MSRRGDCETPGTQWDQWKSAEQAESHQAASVQVGAGHSLHGRLRLLLGRKVHEREAPAQIKGVGFEYDWARYPSGPIQNPLDSADLTKKSRARCAAIGPDCDVRILGPDGCPGFYGLMGALEVSAGKIRGVTFSSHTEHEQYSCYR